MTKFGVTKDGFNRKTYNEILEELNNRARELYGENINLSNTSFLGMHLQNEAWELAEMWELAEDVYYSSFVDSAEGISLDNTGKFITITRKPAQKSKGIITIKGTDGTKINKGFRVATGDLEKVFETTQDGIIGELGIIKIPIISVETGLEMNVPPYSIAEIVNPISGVDEVYNEDITTGGLDIEPDKEFRDRYNRSPSRGGGATREAVEAALLDMQNVTDAFVDENEEMIYVEGVPPKALAPYVFGGEDEEVARTIMKAKAGGIRSYGTTEILVADDKGKEHTIGFTRPTVKDIYVTINITKDKGYPGDDVITRAVINYIGGEDKDGISYKGLKLGENVVISKLMASVMCLEGIKDIDVTVSINNIDFISTNIEIAKKEIAKTKFDKVVINYV